MPARALSSATISFGLVAIPIKLFTATSPVQVRFNMLHPETKGRVKQQYIEPGSGQTVERSQLLKGYEYSRGQFVVFSDEEVKALEVPRSSSIDIVQFVPLASVDLLHVEKSYFLGPDKGGDKAYRLLTEAMERSGKVAVGRYAARGKEQLILLRPYRDGLLMHQLFYATEVRSMGDVDTGATFDFSELEFSLAEKLIDELSAEAFDPSQYEDSYEKRVLAAVEQKVQGREVTTVHEVPKAQVIDLFEALQQSLKQPHNPESKKRSEGAKAKKAARPSKRDAPPEGGAELKPRPVKKATPRRKASRSKAG